MCINQQPCIDPSTLRMLFKKWVSIDPDSKSSYDLKGYFCDHVLHFKWGFKMCILIVYDPEPL